MWPTHEALAFQRVSLRSTPSYGCAHPPLILACCTAISLSTLVTACGRDCTDVPSVQVSMPATVQRSGQTTTVRLFAETVDERGSAPFLHHFFLDDISHDDGVGSLWSMQAQGQGAGVIEWLTVSLQGKSFQAGDVVQVSSIPGDAITTGVWGYPLSEGGEVQVVAPGFTTASASGTIQVLGVGPLRLTLDIRASNAAGEEIALQGDMTASAGQTQSCLSD
jgi:hypothetical protein